MSFLPGYRFRKKITVQVAYLDASQTDFPLYVPINADTDIGASCLSTGYDVRFTASDETTELPFERVSFAVAAGAATGIFWVKTALATSPATDIYVYYGNASATDVSSPSTTFSAYTRVWHLSEAYGTGAGNYKDALGVGNLTLTDADGDSAQGTGVVGKCVDLNGDADFLTDADHADHDPGGAMTVECFVKPTSTVDYGGFAMHDLSQIKWGLYQREAAPNTKVRFYVRTASGFTSAITTTLLSTANWNYLAGVYDRTLATARVKIYINGASENPQNGYDEDISVGDEGITIGKYSTYINNGLEDEVRYSKDAKSDSWLKFVYYNITEADNELTWDVQEASSSDIFLFQANA